MSSEKEFLTAQELKDRMTKNNNRCTAKPYLLLLRKRRAVVVDGDFGGKKRFVENYSGDYHTEDTKERLIEVIKSWYGMDDEEYFWSDKKVEEYYQIKSYYEDEYFETENVFLTDQGYQDHKATNGHNLGKHDTYGIHAFRNKEIKSLFNLIDENIEQQTKLDAKDKKIERLKKENEKLKKCAEFYGNEMNYSIDDYRGISGEMRTRCVLYSDCEERNDFYSYAGKLARQTLKELGNKNEPCN